MTDVVDVAVVGAGLSGLYAARRLRETGLSVRVVEARKRVGGRTFADDVGGARFDLGGQWVGPTHNRVRRLADELGLRLFPQSTDGAKVVDVDGEVRRYRGLVPRASWRALLQVELGLRRLDAMARRIAVASPATSKGAALHDATTVGTVAERLLPHPQARGLFDVAVRTVFGAEPGELSMLYFLFYLNAAGGFRALVDVEGGAQQDRVEGGAARLAEELAARLGAAVVLDNPVVRIDRSGVRVRVVGTHHTVEARHVVMAIPPHLISRIVFEPALPPRRMQWLQRWSMGATVKCVVTYRQAGWRAAGLSGEAVCPEGPISCVFDGTSPDGATPALVAFIVGRHARSWSARRPYDRRALLVGELERLLGAAVDDVTDVREQDWTAEPWSEGCPVGAVAPGALTQTGDLWRRPEGAISWAGTEHAQNWCGYLEGALEAGERAASEAIARLSG